jgi:hypothetical protein
MTLCNADVIFLNSLFLSDLKCVVVLTGAKLYGREMYENLTIDFRGLSQ